MRKWWIVTKNLTRHVLELGQLFKNVPGLWVCHWLLVCISEASAPKIETILWEKNILALFATWKPKLVVVEKWPSTKNSICTLITLPDFYIMLKSIYVSWTASKNLQFELNRGSVALIVQKLWPFEDSLF